MTLEIWEELEQGTDEWRQARAGIVTASVVGQLITAKAPSPLGWECPECEALPEEPCVSLSRKGGVSIKTLHPTRRAPDDAPPVLEVATTETAEKLTAHLAAERITGHVEETYTSRDMERGTLAEPYARDIYAEHYAPVEEVGFMVRDHQGQRIGFSPDGLVHKDGLIEVKSPRAKTHVKTIIEDRVPAEHMAQIQTGLFVSGRDWCDFISYCPGHPLYVKRVYPDDTWQEAIVEAVDLFEESSAAMIGVYNMKALDLPATPYVDLFEEEILI